MAGVFRVSPSGFVYSYLYYYSYNVIRLVSLDCTSYLLGVGVFAIEDEVCRLILMHLCSLFKTRTVGVGHNTII